MERELKRMFEIKEPDMVMPPTLPPDLRSRIGRQRIILGGLVAAAAVALVFGGFAVTSAVSTDAAPVQPAEENNLPPERHAEGIFADVGGWIAFGDDRGIWAVDPTGPGDQSDMIQLSPTPGLPKAWSPDGSKLLVQRATNGGELFLLDTDGTERRLTHADWTQSGAEFAPDGTEVIYAAGPRDDKGGIYSIDAEGGTPELLLAADAMLYEPALSPDGSQIAYFSGWGDSSHSLRVMNSDGTGTRVVLENDKTMAAGHVTGLDWSPNSQHLVFALSSHGVYVVGIDGSGLKQVSSEGVNPSWSPDGSLISYSTGGGSFDALVIARRDGTRVKEFDYGRSGPWNPR